ncbi:alpha-ketoglutarate-dependent dioxygenase alkB homolog 4 [Thalassophryne amazonica]|uniref:alpha-ketoglutarate-dependent dioxygenase alkB homolog 4 n=1 Tax=Thalassophryne amazonica TaxID=390379 RepID=UPI00147214B0|nr:alpha-ketoglutarate-dependent dioxygenase alkB homolog 4 [Thalassophryne amazonica]XP_034033702.1 alpha-ketoglutarate-dependent dioxygenase alkB homolog 4 [Thalassophryne amazonica]
MAAGSGESFTSCVCKGIRRCLICESVKGKRRIETEEHKVVHHFIYDPVTRTAIREDAEPSSFPFPGVFLWENFISEEEEMELISTMDQDLWIQSQSGRRKQDFGPKVNFKKRKVHVGSFHGLPAWSQKLVLRMQAEVPLAGFQPVEQCNLDYNPQLGSAIDPHLDDSWLWGERLVSINLLSDTILSMSLEQGLPEAGLEEGVHVAVHLPRRALVMLCCEARHRWKHAIHRKDIHERRVCSTFRELSAEFLPGGAHAQLGVQLLDIALSFQGSSV